MKPVVTRLYAVLVALALVGLIAWSVADWYQQRQQAELRAQTALRQAAGLVSDLSIRSPSLEGAALNRLMSRSLGADGRWKMIVLASPERGTEYYRGPRPAVPVDKAVPQWDARTASEVKVSLPVFRAQGPALKLEAIYEFYGRSEVFSLLKACGLTLIGLVVLTTLVVLLASRSRPTETETVVPEEDSAEPETSLDQVPFDLATEDEPLETVGSLPVEANDEYWFDEELTLDDLPPLDDSPVPAPTEELSLEDLPPLEDRSTEAVAAPEEAPAPSLFSPATGMGWESFLPTRLDHELERCASQNQDLALILLAVKTGTVDPQAWGVAVREAFPSVDLDFEHEGGAAVVLPGRSLEQALKAARGFVESADRYWNGVVIHAGVAARSGRLLSAATLLSEAGSAKRRSLAGTVRVLGLKTDPDRYRDHLAAGSAEA